MTLRDRTALCLIAAGAVLAIAVAGAYGGWRAAGLVLSVVLLAVGFALAFGDPATVVVAPGEGEDL